MHALIQEKLLELEKTQQVKILYAAESGSRAWGFASPDSDYDVRFLYLRETEAYLKIDRPRDVIEWQLEGPAWNMTEELDKAFLELAGRPFRQCAHTETLAALEK